MSANHSPLAAAQVPANLNNENTAAHYAYRLISQLRQHSQAPVAPLPKKPLDTLDWQAAERTARSKRAV